jgi:hypothetical protein
MQGAWRDGRLLMGEYLLAGGNRYWLHCLTKAFFAALPFAVLFSSVVALFWFGKGAKDWNDPPHGAALPVLCPARYKAVKLWYGTMMPAFALPGIMINGMTVFSNAGDNMEVHELYGLFGAAAFLIPLSIAAFVRRWGTHSVEVRADGLVVHRGDGWGPVTEIPWESIGRFEDRVIGRRRRPGVGLLRIFPENARPVAIREDGVYGFGFLRDEVRRRSTAAHAA